MIRLTLLLCGGLFLAMLIGGRDHGQQRFGLIPQPAAPAPVVAKVEIAEVAPVQPKSDVAVFAPAEPVMATPVALESTPVVAVAAADTGKVLFVGARSANVRAGPGQDFDVVGRLARGEAVLVVADGEGPDGWSLIRIEGDGVEGYIASRLLTE